MAYQCFVLIFLPNTFLSVFFFTIDENEAGWNSFLAHFALLREVENFECATSTCAQFTLPYSRVMTSSTALVINRRLW